MPLPVRRPSFPLLVALAAYLAAALCYALVTPLWQAPDEPAHYNYVRYLVEHQSLPVLQPGDYPHEYLEELKAAGFPPEMSIASIHYESHQPPLYYSLAAPILWPLVGEPLATQVYGLRLLSVALGATALLLTYRLGLRLWPRSSGLAAALAATSALVPMHTAVSAAINNDLLAEVLVIATVLVGTNLSPGPSADAGRGVSPFARFGKGGGGLGSLGLIAGLCILTKLSAAIALPLALSAVAVAGHACRGVACNAPTRRRPGMLRSLALALLPALFATALWVGRNMLTYGLGDPLGQARHDAIVTGQLRTGELLAQVGLAEFLRRGIETAFKSFWGVFGWMGVPMHEQVYWMLAIGSAVAALGLALGGWARPRQRGQARAWPWLAILGVWGVLSLAGLVWYNLKFVQPQGRYLFAAMPVWAAMLVEGPRQIQRRVPIVWRWPRQVGALALMALWLLDIAGALYYVRLYL